jgi:hypothetical protein
MELCNSLALRIILYGGVIWTLVKKDKKKLASVEMKIFKRTEE